jgi:hypothetical protein
MARRHDQAFRVLPAVGRPACGALAPPLRGRCARLVCRFSNGGMRAARQPVLSLFDFRSRAIGAGLVHW